MNYLNFITQNLRFLAFGFFLNFFSAIGHTFFVGLFSADIRKTFDLTHGEFGLAFSIATFVAAIFIMLLGHKIDSMDLRHYSLMVCGLITAACALMAAAPTVLVLVIAIIALRLAIVLMSHTSLTSMARYFDATRGRAIAVVSMGLPAAEAVTPLMAVLLIGTIGWRQTWALTTVSLVVVLVPLVIWTLMGHGERHRRHLREVSARAARGGETGKQWTRRDVLRDPRFYLIMPAVLAPLWILGGLFFHQVYLAETKGWSLAWLASCFVGYAMVRVPVSLMCGPIVDRLGAARLLPYYLIPMVLALLTLGLFRHPAAALVYMMLAGLSSGARNTITNALWAEIYGVAHLGAVRALVQTVIMFTVALSPVTLGWLIDLGVSMESIVLGCLGGVAVAIVCAVIFSSRAEAPASR